MTTAQPPAPPGPRQTPQARRSAPFPTSPPSPACGGPPAPTPTLLPGAPVRRSGRRQPALTPPRPPRTARAPPHRRHCSSLRCADRRRPTPIHADRRRFTPTDADRSPGSAVVAPRTHPQDGARRPRNDGTAPSRFRGRVAPESRLLGRRRQSRTDGTAPFPTPVPPRAGSVQRARAAATAAALHAAQATRQPLHAVRPPLRQCASHCGSAPPTAAVRLPLRQCAPTGAAPPPLRQCRRRPQGKEGATDSGTVTTATAADRRVTTTAATAQRMEKSGGAFRAPPAFLHTSPPNNAARPTHRRRRARANAPAHARTCGSPNGWSSGLAADQRRTSAIRRSSGVIPPVIHGYRLRNGRRPSVDGAALHGAQQTKADV